MQKTHWKKLQNPNYFGSYEFQPGEEKTLTIQRVQKELVTGEGGRKEEEVVMYFTEPVKPMILNKTNSKMIARLLKTPYVEDWAGRMITLYVDPDVKFGGEVTGGIRVRGKLPPEDKPVDVQCEKCGQVITASGKFTAQQIADASRSKYKKALCITCGQEEKKHAQAAGSNE